VLFKSLDEVQLFLLILLVKKLVYSPHPPSHQIYCCFLAIYAT
jgi:hypothetical protein